MQPMRHSHGMMMGITGQQVPLQPVGIPQVHMDRQGVNVTAVTQKLSQMNEQTWIQLGNLSELLLDPERAMSCYDNALRIEPNSIKALTQIASLCRIREQFPKAVEYFQRILSLDSSNGEVWGALGHCYLMLEDLQKAYAAYQQALYNLPNPKDPKLWYGIGILYDRYGSFEHAEEAFTAVLKMDGKFEKANEIYFRLGIIYKQQQKYDLSLECFKYIRTNPPVPLSEADIWFQIGHVYEQKKEYLQAKEAYEKVLKDSPNHAKVLQQLGWLYHQPQTSFTNQDTAIAYLTNSLEADHNDTQTWYLLGRCHMAQHKYNKAYEAYQQAVIRDPRNPTYWCSIGVLYFQINQYRDALDAYSRAIHINPHISEVWFDLGALYEACGQIPDALDAYQHAVELDPNNPHIKQRLSLLKNAQATGSMPPNIGAPVPLYEEFHPTPHTALSVNGSLNTRSLNQFLSQPKQSFQESAPNQFPMNIPPPDLEYKGGGIPSLMDQMHDNGSQFLKGGNAPKPFGKVLEQSGNPPASPSIKNEGVRKKKRREEEEEKKSGKVPNK